jgi:LysM domain
VSIALRFNCTVTDIKRLNKIDKDNEIFAFKVLRVPLTAHNILLDTLPKIHKSGSNSPREKKKVPASGTPPNQEKLEEKLLVASVTNATIQKSPDAVDRVDEDASEPLIDRSRFRGYPRTIRPPRNDFLTFNGSDCELNWIFLLIVILAFCVIVPLIYVFMVYEHPEKFVHKHDDR